MSSAASSSTTSKIDRWDPGQKQGEKPGEMMEPWSLVGAVEVGEGLRGRCRLRVALAGFAWGSSVGRKVYAQGFGMSTHGMELSSVLVPASQLLLQ